MGATEGIAELMKAMHEREIREMLDFAEFLLAKRDREKTSRGMGHARQIRGSL